jgi:hypothetical protein
VLDMTELDAETLQIEFEDVELASLLSPGRRGGAPGRDAQRHDA